MLAWKVSRRSGIVSLGGGRTHTGAEWLWAEGDVPSWCILSSYLPVCHGRASPLRTIFPFSMTASIPSWAPERPLRIGFSPSYLQHKDGRGGQRLTTRDKIVQAADSLVAVERGPLSDRRDPGDELRLASAETVDADPVLSAERRDGQDRVSVKELDRSISGGARQSERTSGSREPPTGPGSVLQCGSASQSRRRPQRGTKTRSRGRKRRRMEER